MSPGVNGVGGMVNLRTCIVANWIRGEKLYMDLVSMSKTIRGNQYMLTAEDIFSRYFQVYSIYNKEAHTMAKVLMDQHFNVYCLLDQLHSDNGKEFVNNLGRKLFSKFRIQHTTTPPYNLSLFPQNSHSHAQD